MAEQEEQKPSRVARVRDNFNRIARDLDRALRIAGLNGAQHYLWGEARELCWTTARGGDPKPFRFNFRAMADISGRFRREHLSRECRRLIDRRFLYDLGDGTLLLNKRYDTWLDDDGAILLTPEQIKWCQAIVREKPECDEKVTGDVTKRSHAVKVGCDEKVTACDEKVTACDEKVTACDEKVTAPASPLRTPIEDRARPESIREREKEREATPSEIATAAGASRNTPQPTPAYPDEDTAPSIIHAGPHAEDPAWARAFWVKLWAAFGSPRVNFGFYEHQRWYRAECWEAALAEAVKRGAPVRSSRLIEAIAADFEANGVPTVAPFRGETRLSPTERRRREDNEAIARRIAERKAKATEGDHGQG